MPITKEAVIQHAATVASAIETLADVADFKQARPVEVIAAATRAVLGVILEAVKAGKDPVSAEDIEARLAAILDDAKALDAKYDAALAAKFDNSTD